MEKKCKVINLRGWKALEAMLHEEGLSNVEIEEAQASFYNGINVLAKLFLSCHSLKIGAGKRIK